MVIMIIKQLHVRVRVQTIAHYAHFSETENLRLLLSTVKFAQYTLTHSITHLKPKPGPIIVNIV